MGPHDKQRLSIKKIVTKSIHPVKLWINKRKNNTLEWKPPTFLKSARKVGNKQVGQS